MKEITVRLAAGIRRWQSMNTTRSSRVVDLPEPAPAKMRASGARQRIIAHCSSDGAPISPAVTASATRARMAAIWVSLIFRRALE